MSVSRRSYLKLAGGAVVGSTGLGIGVSKLGVGPSEVHAATRELKLRGAQEFTSACNFCSCGCGMVMHVRDGKLVNLEGDPDHVINEGALCSKGAGISAAHTSDQRLRTPLYRAPGSDRWEQISWDDALSRIAARVQKVRDQHWVASEKLGERDVPVNRTDAMAFLGGAQNTNEECYLFAKMARLFGTAYVEHQARL